MEEAQPLRQSVDLSVNSAVDQLEFTPVDQIHKLYERVLQAHSSGITKSLDWRLHQLRQLAYLMQENESVLEEALAIDLGRPRIESHLGDLIFIRKEVIHALKHVKSWMKPHSVRTDLTWTIANPKISHEPKGVVLIFGAWNYPIGLLFGPLIGAIAGGNSVVLKPSENCPATSKVATSLIRKYMDPNNICVINGAVDQNSSLLNLKFDHIFFTGSSTIGKIIAAKAAENLTPITLELGGKCPAIVFDDANLVVAARRIAWAKVVNAGQTCIAPDYVLVSQKNEQKFIDAMRSILEEFYPLNGPSSDQSKSGGKLNRTTSPDSQFCKIINQRQFDRLNRCLSETKGEVIKLNFNSDIQPDTADRSTLKIPVTLVRNVTEDDPLMRAELFGPILPILTYNSEHEDIVQRLHRINQSAPLAVYAFSQSDRNLDFVRNNTKSGQFVCNDLLVQFTIPGLPFGGVGTSGIGNYHGYHSFLTFTYERSTLNLPFWADFLLKSRYPPYTNLKFNFFQIFMGPERLSGKSSPEPPSLTTSKDFKRLLDPSLSNSKRCLRRPLVLKTGAVLVFLVYWVLARYQQAAGGGGSSQLPKVDGGVEMLKKKVLDFFSHFLPSY